MKVEMAMILAKVAYAKVFRELIVEKIDDPNSDIDEMAVKMFDIIFTYEEDNNKVIMFLRSRL